MGADKASLILGGKSLLTRVIDAVTQVVPASNVVCVAAPDQSLPESVAAFQVARDPIESRGPLAAIATGLAALPGECDAVLAAGCDHPLLSPAVLEAMFGELAESSAVVAEIDGRLQPLPAVYSSSVGQIAARLVEEGRRSLNSLIDVIEWRAADVQALRVVDPELQTFLACNNPADLAVAERRLYGADG